MLNIAPSWNNIISTNLGSTKKQQLAHVQRLDGFPIQENGSRSKSTHMKQQSSHRQRHIAVLSVVASVLLIGVISLSVRKFALIDKTEHAAPQHTPAANSVPLEGRKAWSNPRYNSVGEDNESWCEYIWVDEAIGVPDTEGTLALCDKLDAMYATPLGIWP